MIKYTIDNNGKKIKAIDFDNLNEQLLYIQKPIKDKAYSVIDQVKQEDNFYGTHTLDQSLQGMKYGFDNDTNYFLDNIAQVQNDDGLTGGIHVDVEGFAYDMGSVVEGIPECCLNSNLPTPTPSVTIMVDIAFSWCVSARAISNRGIAITNLINTLLLNGYIVDLYLLRYNSQYDLDIMYTVKIDTTNLSIANIAYVCTPEYFRKIGWITTDVLREKESESGRGQSKILPFMLNKIKKEKIFFIGGDYSDSNITSHLDSVKNANNYILETFKKYCNENKITIKFIENVDKT